MRRALLITFLISLLGCGKTSINVGDFGGFGDTGGAFTSRGDDPSRVHSEKAITVAFEFCPEPNQVSLSIDSPIAAFTKYEPAKKIVPVLFTINDSSDIIGRYAPPATQLPMMAEI